MSDISRFPYGNDLRKPDDWVGLSSTKSKKWVAAYVGGNAFSLGWNAHTVVFFGVESLSMGVFDLKTIGLEAARGPSKIAKFTKRVGENLDFSADYVGRAKKLAENMTLDDIMTPENLYDYMSGNTSHIEADEPFSLDDLNGSWGTIYGGEIEAYGSAAIYFISAGYSFMWSDEYISYEQIYNVAKKNAGIGAAAAAAGGLWVDRKIMNPYLSDSGRFKGSERVYDGNDRPYSKYYSAIDYLRMLPPMGDEVPDYVVKFGEIYAAAQK